MGPSRQGQHSQALPQRLQAQQAIWGKYSKSLTILTSAKKAILLGAWCKEQLKYTPKQRGAAAGLGGEALPSLVTPAPCCVVGLNNPAPQGCSDRAVPRP